jgi:hypothetical protein
MWRATVGLPGMRAEAPRGRPFPSISMQMLLHLLAVSMRRMSRCVLVDSLNRQSTVLALE